MNYLRWFFPVALTVSSQAGTIYQWTDANGTPHFSDSVPLNQPNVQALNVYSGPSTDADQELKQLKKQRKNDSKAESDAAKKAEEAADAKAKLDAAAKDNAVRCKQLQENLQVLNEHGRVRETDPKTGETRYLSEADKEARNQDIQKQIQAFCNN